jgi:hypothetical protein
MIRSRSVTRLVRESAWGHDNFGSKEVYSSSRNSVKSPQEERKAKRQPRLRKEQVYGRKRGFQATVGAELNHGQR